MGDVSGESTSHATFDREGLRAALTRTRCTELTRRLAELVAAGPSGPERPVMVSVPVTDTRGERR